MRLAKHKNLQSTESVAELISESKKLCARFENFKQYEKFGKDDREALSELMQRIQPLLDLRHLYESLLAAHLYMRFSTSVPKPFEYFVKNIEAEIHCLEKKDATTPDDAIWNDIRRRLFSRERDSFLWERMEGEDGSRQVELFRNSILYDICTMVYLLPAFLGNSSIGIAQKAEHFSSYCDAIVPDLAKEQRRLELEGDAPKSNAINSMLKLVRIVSGAVQEYADKTLPPDTFETLKVLSKILEVSQSNTFVDFIRSSDALAEKATKVEMICNRLEDAFKAFHSTGGTNSFSESPRKVEARKNACDTLHKTCRDIQIQTMEEFGPVRLHPSLLLGRREISIFLEAYREEIEAIQIDRLADIANDSKPSNGLGRMVSVDEIQGHLDQFGGVLVVQLRGMELMGYSVLTFPEAYSLEETVPNAPLDLEGPVAVMELTVSKADTRREMRSDWEDETIDAYGELTERMKDGLYALGFRSAICACRIRPLNTSLEAHKRVGWIPTGRTFSYEASGVECMGEVLTLKIRNSALYELFHGDWQSLELPSN